jgi:diguanylate cyclase (GGDEF)-like protein/PAS domain S-box-containing protein
MQVRPTSLRPAAGTPPVAAVALLGGYALLLAVGLRTPLAGGHLAVTWPAGAFGLLLLALTVRSAAAEALAAAGLLAVTVLVALSSGLPPGRAVALGACALVQCWLAARLSRPIWRRAVLVTSEMLWTLSGACLAGAAAGAVPGLYATSATGDLRIAGAGWVVRNGVDMFGPAAVLMILSAGGRMLPARGTGRPRWSAAQRLEAAACTAILAGSFVLVFGTFTGLPVSFALLPLVVWAALRLDTRLVAVQTLLAAACVAWFSARGHGPFAVLAPDSRVLLVHIFIGVATVLALQLALGRDERARLATQLQQTRDRASSQAALLDTVIDSISDGVVVVDGSGRTVLRNPAARAMVGLPPTAEGIGTWPEHYGLFRADGSPFPAAELPISLALAGTHVQGVDLIIRNPGHPAGRVLNVAAHPLDPTHGLSGAVAAMRDVTGARAVEGAVRHTRDLFAGVLNAATEQSIIGTDPQGVIAVFNVGAERMLGYGADEVRGLSPAMFHDPDEIRARAAELGIEPGFRVFVQAAEAGQAETRQWTYLTKAGTRIQVRLTVTAMRDDRGDISGFIGVATDVTDQLETLTALGDSEQRFRLAFHSATTGLLLASPDAEGAHRVTMANPAWCQLVDLPVDLVLGCTLTSLVPPEDRAELAEQLAALAAGRVQSVRREQRYRRTDGSYAWSQLSITEVRPQDGAPYVICLAEDVSARKQAEDELTRQALHDPLTGLANRSLLSDRIEQSLAGSVRTGLPTGLAYLDLDGFKSVNDAHGHAAGDELLVETSRRLERCLRPADTVSRVGGDEFVLVCPDVENLPALMKIADRVLQCFQRPFAVDGGSVLVGASIGLAMSQPETEAGVLLREADEAMYQAKRTGKNRIVTAASSEELQARTARSLRLLPRLEAALTRNEFVLHGQPVLNLVTGQIDAVETLLRWYQPDGTIVTPGQFLDVVEAHQLMLGVGDRVLRESCRMAAAWNGTGDGPAVHVNISGRQLEAGHLYRDVQAALAESGLPGELLVLELTETHMPMMADSLLRDLNQLREAGVRIAIDDLGSGYSSLARLTQLPIDMLKIDRHFISGIDADPSCEAVVKAVLGIGEALEIPVVAEGIETVHQEERLRTWGCSHGQGYLYGAAENEADLADILARELTPAPVEVHRRLRAVGSRPAPYHGS